MALLERVAMLLRANLNDLLDQAENPEKLLKQMILDMQNQQVQNNQTQSQIQRQQGEIESQRRQIESLQSQQNTE